MINAEAIETLYVRHARTLAEVVALENALRARFFGLEHAVHGMVLAAMTGEVMVMIGPPGTAKSRLVRAFCHLVGLVDDGALASNPKVLPQDAAGRAGYFEYLLTQFTEPSELFGFFDLGRLFATDGRRELVRDSNNMLQEARVVFLDEVFNASSAILNALLTFMNERKFHDRGRVIETPLELLFAATNHPPREEGLAAAYDRFLLRCRVDNVSSGYRLSPEQMTENIADLVAAAWTETHSAPLTDRKPEWRSLLDDLAAYRVGVDALTRDGSLQIDRTSPLFARLADLVVGVRARGLSEMSNRRLVKFTAVILAEALLRRARGDAGGAAIVPSDLAVVLDYGLDQDDPDHVLKLRRNLLGAP